ncbi:MAG: aminopeptidase, partial [Bacteroidales bacterium]|nr:aminopeptidase [Bacteroidales bacterium]
MRKIFLPFIILSLLVSSLFAQDSLYYRQNIKILSSPEYHGRGYAFKGDSIAAEYIAQEFKRLKLE